MTPIQRESQYRDKWGEKRGREMGRRPCCSSEENLNRGAWTSHEDKLLTDYIRTNGEGRWSSLPKKAGLKRCGKSCRLRWMNYLRPDIRRGNISPDEEELIIRLHRLLGNRWSLIAGRLPGRTDNEIKNYWNTNLSKRLRNQTNVPPATQNQKLNDQSGKPNRKIPPLIISNNKKKETPSTPSSAALRNANVIRTRAVKCTKAFIDPPDLNDSFRGPLPSSSSIEERSDNTGSSISSLGDLMIDFDKFLQEYNFSNLDEFGVSDCYYNGLTSISEDRTLVQTEGIVQDLSRNGSADLTLFLDTKEDWLGD